MEKRRKEQFLLFSTKFCYLFLEFHVKTGTRISLRDKRLFEISEVEITRVDCIFLSVCLSVCLSVSLSLSNTQIHIHKCKTILHLLLSLMLVLYHYLRLNPLDGMGDEKLIAKYRLNRECILELLFLSPSYSLLTFWRCVNLLYAFKINSHVILHVVFLWPDIRV